MALKIDGDILGVEAEVEGIVIFSNISTNSNHAEQESENDEKTKEVIKEVPLIRKRGAVTQAFVIKVDYEPAGKVYFTFSYNTNKELVELFVNISKPSSEINAAINSIAKLVSVSLKHGAEVPEISKHLKDIDAGQYVPTKFPGRQKRKIIKSLPDLIGYALEFYGEWDKIVNVLQNEENINVEVTKTATVTETIKDDTKEVTAQKVATLTGPSCPICNSTLIRADGCWSCPSCGYSKCE